jgi:NAD(P)-dependent dehydrogenase (short-subunit alcohol dehydrogenase family)
MDLQLLGKRALVTGSSSGIGAETARVLAAEGAQVVIHGRRADAVAALVTELARAGHVAKGVTGDLSTDAGADQAARAALAAFGGIDILVNNAGLFVAPGKAATGEWFGDDTAEHGTALFEANVNSVFRMVRRVVPDMRARGWGRVIMLASTIADMPREGFPQYAVTKSANLNQTVSLSKALAGAGVTVNSISPGLIRTPAVEPVLLAMAGEFGWGDDWEVIERKAATHAFVSNTGRLGRPHDIARAVAFLASPLSDFINGANLRVDGGGNPTVN